MSITLWGGLTVQVYTPVIESFFFSVQEKSAKTLESTLESTVDLHV